MKKLWTGVQVDSVWGAKVMDWGG